MAVYRSGIKLFKSLTRNGAQLLQTESKIALVATRACSTKRLMEFFDVKENWAATEVKVGRSWRKEELRIKSNSDLHKLWFILLKERNMLYTMEEESKEQIRLFPNPERIDKVEESMENLEEVVRERNRAYHLLETGETGEIREEEMIGPFGLPVKHRETEHVIPKQENAEWLKEHENNVNLIGNKDVEMFVKRYKERERGQLRKKRTRDFNHVIGLLKRFPDMDMEALKEQYPEVDIEKAKQSRKCRGHFVPK